MAETRINEYLTLKCDCGGDIFHPIARLKVKGDGGTITEPAGYTCHACRAVVDARYMRLLVERQMKVQQIKDLQGEIQEMPQYKPAKA